MSRQKYPRHDSSRKLPENTTKQCSATNCAALATRFTFIQFTYMRGEDEGVYHCEAHALHRGHDPQLVSAWCEQFPTEAWKS